VKRILQYGRHLLRARGRHGTHSPFVYAFVEQVMRARPQVALPQQDRFRPKEAGLLYQTLRYLSPRVICADPAVLDAVAAIAIQALPDVPVQAWTSEPVPPQALLICNADDVLPDRLQHLPDHPLKVLLAGPHEHKAAESIWMQVAASASVKMSIDYWYFGLLVSDPAFKAKQHFRLR